MIGLGEIVVEFDRLVEIGQRIGELPGAAIKIAAREIGRRIGWVGLRGRREILDGLIIAPRLSQGEAAIGIGRRHRRIDLDRRREILDGAGIVAGAGIGGTARIIGTGIARILLDRLAERFDIGTRRGLIANPVLLGNVRLHEPGFRRATGKADHDGKGGDAQARNHRRELRHKGSHNRIGCCFNEALTSRNSPERSSPASRPFCGAGQEKAPGAAAPDAIRPQKRVSYFLTTFGAGAAITPLALQALAGQLAGAADGLGLLAGALLGRLLVMTAQLHLPEDALTLHFLLESAESLVDVVVTDENLHGRSCILAVG